MANEPGRFPLGLDLGSRGDLLGKQTVDGSLGAHLMKLAYEASASISFADNVLAMRGIAQRLRDILRPTALISFFK